MNDNNNWNALVQNKRNYSSVLHDLTQKMIVFHKTLSEINENIRSRKNTIVIGYEKIEELKKKIESMNQELISLSDQLSKSKGFLSTLEIRSSEYKDEITVQQRIDTNKVKIETKQYSSEYDKNILLENYKKALMEQEALKAIRVIKDQVMDLEDQSKTLGNNISNSEQDLFQVKKQLEQNKVRIGQMHTEKTKLIEEKDLLSSKYNQALNSLEEVNKQLDMITNAKRLGFYGRNVDQKIISDVKQNASRKMKDGEKLTLDELRLLYDD